MEVMMRKFLIPVIALASVATAVPATAQNWGGNRGYDRGYGYNQGNGGGVQSRLQAISFQIDRLQQRGNLTNGEARSLRRELAQVANRTQRYRWDDYRPGYDRGERSDLWNRLQRLEQRVRYEARDGDRAYGNRGFGDRGYGNAYGYNDRDRDGVPNRYDRYDGNPYRR
jgi:hypothetical protein